MLSALTRINKRARHDNRMVVVVVVVVEVSQYNNKFISELISFGIILGVEIIRDGPLSGWHFIQYHADTHNTSYQ